MTRLISTINSLLFHPINSIHTMASVETVSMGFLKNGNIKLICVIRIKELNRLQTVSESLNDNIDFDYSSETPLKSIIDTPLTDSLVNEIFHQQNNVNDTLLLLFE